MFDFFSAAPSSRPARLTSPWLMAAAAALLVAGFLPGSADACTTTNYSWGGATADWTTASDWSPSGVPGSGTCDTATDSSVPAHTITLNSALGNPLQSVDLNCPSCMLDLQPSGTLELAGNSSFSGGAILRLSGNLVVDSGVILTINNGSTLDLQGGSISGSGLIYIQSGGTLLYDGSNSTTVDATTIENHGTVTLQPTAAISIDLNNGAGIKNYAAFDIGDNVAFNTGSGIVAFTNSGTVTKNGTDFTNVNVPFYNMAGASVVVGSSAGGLQLSAGGTGDAPFTINANATLDFPSGTYTLSPNGVVSGAGTLSISGATLSIGGVTSPAGFSLSAGTMTGAGFLSVGSNMSWTGGTMTGTGGAELAGTALGVMSDGGTGNITLSNRTFNIYGSMDISTTSSILFSSGAHMAVFGSLGISSDAYLTSSGDLTASLTIEPNGTLFSAPAGTAVIELPFTNNYSVFAVTGDLEIRADGTHSGNFYAGSSAEIEFHGGPTGTIIFNGSLNADGNLCFPTGNAIINGSYNVNGTTEINGGMVTFNIDSYTGKLLLNGGTVVLNANLIMTGMGYWSGGTITGTYAFIVDDNGNLVIDGLLSAPTLDAGFLTNHGLVQDITTTNPLTFQNGSELHNHGTYIIEDSGSVMITGVGRRGPRPVALASGVHRILARGFTTARPGGRTRRIGRAPNTSGSGGLFENFGTLRKTNSGTAIFSPDLENDGYVLAEAGVINFTGSYDQTGGNTTLGAGDIIVSSTLVLDGGELNGAGTVTGDVTNNDGNVSPGGSGTIGTINIQGNYTQASGGASTYELSGTAPGQYDLISVSGTATLDGSTTVSLLAFTPANGDTFDVLTFANRSGNFDSESQTLPTFGAHGVFTYSYTPTSYRLTATVTPSSADLAVTMSGPPNVAATGSLSYGVTVRNYGPDPTTGTTTVVDTLPAGVTGASGSGTNWTCGAPTGGTITCTYALSVAASGIYPTLTFDMTAPATAGPITNLATVSGPDNDVDSTNNSATINTTVDAAADLKITKSGPSVGTSGQNLVYTITVTNMGPSDSSGVVVSDPTPANATFVSTSGSCTGAFPCSVGTITVGQSAVITATYTTSGTFNGVITNTASVSSSVTSDPDSTNNSATKTTSVDPSGGTSADVSVAKSGPNHANPGSPVTFTITVTNAGPSTATGITVSDPTPAGLTFNALSGACAGTFPCAIPTLNAHQSLVIFASYTVTAPGGDTVINQVSVSSTSTDLTPANNNASWATQIVTAPVCPVSAPALLTPTDGSIVTSPVSLSWSPVDGAISYSLSLAGPNGPLPVQPIGTALTIPLPAGTYTWSVQANGLAGCPNVQSTTATFIVCSTPATPLASVVGESTTGQTYAVAWNAVDAASSYELQESETSTFNDPTSFMISGNSKDFTKNVSASTPFYYRVRAIPTCGDATASFSPTVVVVVVPLPHSDGSGENVNLPAETASLVTFQVFIPGQPGITTSFVATADKPWLAVTPTGGVIGPDGTTVTVSADPSDLTNGTWTGTIIVVYGSAGVSGSRGSDSTPASYSIPVSISLVTPVTPVSLATSANSVLIPSVGHLPGASSNWRSDIRVANVSSSSRRYQLNFNGGGTSTFLKQTIITVDAGATTALDDIVRNWFGVGSLGDSSNGVLTITPLGSDGKVQSQDVSVQTAAVVSSRTYNTAATGTLGQFIPGLPISTFIGASNPATLSLQQIIQSDTYRTNLGLVEGTGKPVNLQVTAFDAAGTELFQLPVSLKGGEQRQLNSFLAQNGVTLQNGRIEVKVLSGAGLVTAYASVVDSRTNDPLLVSGVPVGGTGSSRFVVPGVANIDSALAKWRSDVRVFNSGAAPQAATLTLYPTDNPSASISQAVTINPGEVKALDDIVHNVFGATNRGGTLHVTTAVAAPLVVTARTYDQTTAGTVGQFIPAVTPDQGVGSADRALHIIQVENSVRYRTNLGIAEMSGKPAMVEVAVILPDSKVSPKVQIPLAAYESKQIPILSSLGLGAVYNARISVRVIGGDGLVTAYGSVIDMTTQDPTYIPAQ